MRQGVQSRCRFRDGVRVAADETDASHGLEAPLRAVADRYDQLDRQELFAAATAALAVPDRPVTIEVGPRFVDEEADAA